MTQDPIPVRMLNEAAYCPRLFALEHVFREWADSAETVEGRSVHRRVDKPSKASLPESPAVEEDPDRPRAVRSVDLSDDALGLVARIDLVEVVGSTVVPVDYKRGTAPEVDEGAWEPERVQVCGQGLLLRAHGYTCDHGELYFAASRARVRVEFTDELIAATLAHLEVARGIVARAELPAPLVDSPKCRGCSLAGICLPDETNLLRGASGRVRPLMPARDDGVPLYVQTPGASLGKSYDELVVKAKGAELGRARIGETSRVVVLGNASISTAVLQALADEDVPLGVHSASGWFFGSFVSTSGHNALTRIAQHRVAADPTQALGIARHFVHAKIHNCRVMLRRNAEAPASDALERLSDLAREALRARDREVLMGIEGMAARVYFESFTSMLKEGLRDRFRMDGRNRRPRRDPINALLSFAYATLARELTFAIHAVGLDPYVGFLHQPRPGRPSLALDLMEEFRPIVGDSVVVNAVNNGVLTEADFVIRPTGTALTDAGRRSFIRVIERRLDELVTHPVFGTRISYRRVLETQVRMLGKVVLGDVETYPEFHVR